MISSVYFNVLANIESVGKCQIKLRTLKEEFASNKESKFKNNTESIHVLKLNLMIQFEKGKHNTIKDLRAFPISLEK